MLKIIDLNRELIDQCQQAGFDAEVGDYFLGAYKTQQPVFVTASNPSLTFGGGLDLQFTKHFPELVRYKQYRGGGNERIANICFCITVNDDLQATKESIRSALEFAIGATRAGETLVLSGLGTGIGGLSVEEFVDVLKDLHPGTLRIKD